MYERKVTFLEKPGRALNPQKKINQSNFPFTLNATIGCFFGCLYCYTQGFPFSVHTEFGKEVKVKTWLPARLDEELEKYRHLPQHVKRVQVNESSEGYLPQVMARSRKELGRDIVQETLEVFGDHWRRGNYWMVHLLTKSHMILKHLDTLRSMRDQVQVELTITTLSEARKKILEGSAPTIRKRLGVIKALSDRGVFVRVMAMPFIGNRDEAAELRRIGFESGARAFKHKKMNYWDEDALLEGRLTRVKGRKDVAFEDLQVKSGEHVIENGEPKTVEVLMPTPKWKTWEKRMVPIENSGYSEMNDIDWGYQI
ncbi:MAG: hypothetical protein CVU57_06265 [Deltaproteobacteria bacterium HGW-Deltaproteobacteria-15]|nr:MAG: hypothetical protein CVU57_06265 [Deltaproteobacteria bacterium HGW-Deltaproteobacteria-15]